MKSEALQIITIVVIFSQVTGCATSVSARQGCRGSTAFSTNKEVTGRVISMEDSKPLPGVLVLVIGERKHPSFGGDVYYPKFYHLLETDTNGEYRFSTKKADFVNIRIAAIGYKAVDYPVQLRGKYKTNFKKGEVFEIAIKNVENDPFYWGFEIRHHDSLLGPILDGLFYSRIKFKVSRIDRKKVLEFLINERLEFLSIYPNHRKSKDYKRNIDHYKQKATNEGISISP